jgi:xylulokinase
MMANLSLFDLTGRKALVTGGAVGIGRACAVALAGAGADVAIVDIDEENLRLALDELRALCEVRGEMVAVGGIGKSGLWRQILADALNIRIVKTNVGQEAGSLGAAAVAAVGGGLWKNFTPIQEVHQIQDVAVPDPASAAVYEQFLPAFDQSRRDQARLGDMLVSLGL